MKKKLFAAILCGVFTLSTVSVYADEKDDRIAELEMQLDEANKTIKELQEELAKYTEGSSQEEYKIGDTWTVPGQWSLKIDSVEETADRNEYEEKQPGAVYIVTYTYENLGYEDADGLMNGLYIDLSLGNIVDSAGKMGYSYPGDIAMYPQETPVGASCEGQACIGVDNAGSFKIHFSTFDGTDAEQSAVFSIDV